MTFDEWNRKDAPDVPEEDDDDDNDAFMFRPDEGYQFIYCNGTIVVSRACLNPNMKLEEITEVFYDFLRACGYTIPKGEF